MLGVVGPANATAAFIAIVALFGAAVLAGVGLLRRAKERPRPPFGR